MMAIKRKKTDQFGADVTYWHEAVIALGVCF
jgi:hypothetical protein